ncbi:MAG: helix-turn-helix domain-containing protein [Leptospiraceae bacterium]|nr:helix-turn-helix domain-containing protein [Leptospiraceae bacterium]
MRTGIWIPEWINNLGLKGNMRLLYAEIVSLSKNGCFASNQHFADVLGLKQDTISRMISTLKKNGFIIQTSFDGRKRTLVPLRLDLSNVESGKIPMENKNPVQSRVGAVSKTVSEYTTISYIKLQSKKKENTMKDGPFNEKEWKRFLEFAIKLSGSTFSKLKKYKSPEMLPSDLKIYYERFLNVV